MQIINGVKPGVTGIDYGEVIANGSSNVITINHNLKAVPKFMMLFIDDIPEPLDTSRPVLLFYRNKEKWLTFRGTNFKGTLVDARTGTYGTIEGYEIIESNTNSYPTTPATNTQVTFQTIYNFSGAYHWVAIA